MTNAEISASIFMLRRGQVTQFEAEIRDSAGEVLELADNLDGYFIPLPGIAKEPSWAMAIKSILETPGNLSVRAQAPGGLLVINRSGRTFVVSFGHAWLKLKDEWLEPDFGRRVALNAIAKDNLIEIRAEQVFAKWHLASERAPLASSVDAFGVDFDRDLVSTIEGLAKDALLGDVIRGGTSLRGSLSLSNLIPALDRAESLYVSNAYKKRWPEVENLISVRDQKIIDQLEARLDADLSSGLGSQKLVLFTPSLRRGDLAPVDSYVFGRLTKSPAVSPYLTFSSWQSHLSRKGESSSVASAKTTNVHLLDDGRQEISTCSVFDCFGYETTFSRRHYVLSSGVWYEAVQSFVNKINTAVASIAAPSITLPIWNGSEHEGEYNLRCCSVNRSLLHFDAKNFQFGGGKSKFEFCDLMHPADRVLFFAKIASKSSGMSHLVEQTRRTAELLFSADDSYRQELRKVFAKHHPKVSISWLATKPRPGDFDLCLVSLGRKASDLPFFAKCSLARLSKELLERGHNMSFLAV